MNRRNFIKTVPALASTPLLLGNTTQRENNPTPKPNYFVNCYIQNQKYWPLEEYKGGDFKNGKLYFTSLQGAVDFIDAHSLVTPFYNEVLYEVFHEISDDVMIAPKHIFTYWAKIKEGEPPETIRWIRPDYIDHAPEPTLFLKRA